MKSPEEQPPISEAYAALAELGLSLGVGNLKDHPGCWEHQIDELWWVAANGHSEPMKCSKGTEVPPFNFYVMCNGWPCGLVGPYGGVLILMHGEDGDTEGELIAAVRAQTK